MQVCSRGLALLRCFPQPGSVTRGAPGGPAGTGRNPMADRPQDSDGGLRPAVRSVQHLNLPADHKSIGDAGAWVIGKAKVPFPC